VVGNKTYIVTYSLVTYSNTFKSNKKKNTYQKLKIYVEYRPLSLDQYRGMTQIQREVFIKSLYVNVHEKNIFDLLSWVHAEIRDEKNELPNVDFSFNDENVRCKFSVVYTEFRITILSCVEILTDQH
jgi:CRISPR/Cas system CSM-associated protein Csm4 (group 5 of RAMP superfamily)